MWFVFGVSAIMVIALMLLVGFGFFLSGEVSASKISTVTTTNASPSCAPNQVDAALLNVR